jgi:lipopolysaccharide/colanic/teichoic acid biosynthesis glycosyltransferase/nucleoside-diphosphate-sugar epimerase
MTHATRILITGATGFVGAALLERLCREPLRLRATVLPGEACGHLPAAVERSVVEPLSESSDYSAALQGVDTVIHLAARVHVMRELARDPLGEFRKVNTCGTARLARQAVQAGVQRFVFLSTIGVHGNLSAGRPFVEADQPRPHNDYSLSKLEAEIELGHIAAQTSLELVVVRAPLVYGPGNPGNFLALLGYLSRGIPLPLASVENLKSLVYSGNLADALACCATHPGAAGQTFLVSDGEDLSTPQLLRRVAAALGRPCRLVPFPPGLLRLSGALTGKAAAAARLLDSLQVDSSQIRRELGWSAPFSVEEGLAHTARWFATFHPKAKSCQDTRPDSARLDTLFAKRIFDTALSLVLLIVCSVPMLLVAALVKLTSRGPVLYWSDRVGRHNLIFPMPKFRTMLVETPAVATHLLADPDRFLTPVGKFLRKSSLDELPQLLSILRGDMSFVGPRPALYNQYDLIELRTQKGVHLLTPGLTGWAQINGRDELPIPVKVAFDVYYLKHRSFALDLRIFLLTFLKVLKREGVTH